MSEPVIGVVGGSGLYEMEGLKDVCEERVETPFGEPSDLLVTGRLGDARLVFLPRHGRGHRLLPSEVNYRANIYALKKLGVEQVISVSAVGSMKEEIVPGHIVIPDQFFDRTAGRRDSTFFGEGVVGHVQFADPVCLRLAGLLATAARQVGAVVHEGGTYICMEGPQFSTRAESRIYRSWGVDIIGMTNVSEAKLAREAELCYATIALATDYDCWHEGHDDVSVEAVVALIKKNVALAKRIIAAAVELLTTQRSCGCGSALAYAIMTDRKLIPPVTREKLDLIIGKYL
ncbi:methylthioadenosine phosphorylase [Geothermobacter ehrlichii]|uniref:S-methyl-5'-thioadenosine phosphorylase n=1 Tax=Geothermobacter ehrlichii TaxID=213224 RepID=A0A5D3WKD2_9BACT|nr:S-methyl-5'-thioadenosine phosphorylase [Geothermobacter ehrlichii]TYO98814.1 methylthioadenosine phosphorylase [Geothermobacter ehrlichii]